MATIRYFSHDFIYRGTKFSYLQHSRLLIYHLFPNVWNASYTISTSIFVDVPYRPPIACISSSLVLYRSLTVVLAASPPSCSTQEKTTTLGGTEPHHSSCQCKESHRYCCHGPVAPLTMGDLEHPPHSPEMSPCDYDLFTKVKEPLREIRYNTRDELI